MELKKVVELIRVSTAGQAADDRASIPADLVERLIIYTLNWFAPPGFSATRDIILLWLITNLVWLITIFPFAKIAKANVAKFRLIETSGALSWPCCAAGVRCPTRFKPLV